jgi:hypothetical protein
VSDHPLDRDRITKLVSTIFADDLRAKPNAQAALLIGLVRMYPDMVARLVEV